MAIRMALLAGVAALALGTGAQAAGFVETFDGEGAGVTAENFTAFSRFTVTTGSVDLLFGYPGLACVGGTGGCVDLDGGTLNAGTLTTSSSYAFQAGDDVVFSFALAGNHRSDSLDGFSAGFDFGGVNTHILNYKFNGVLQWADLVTSGIGSGTSIGGFADYRTFSISFTAAEAGSLFANIDADGGDNVGPLLDNVSLSITNNAVPEPATWAMMLLGFGGLGAVLRRRRVYA